MRIRRTPVELKQFKKIVSQYVADGYPTWYAEQCAWDVLMLERQLKRGTFRSRIAA